MSLKKYVVNTYWDSRVRFLIEMIKRVDYFSKVPNDIAFDLILSLKQKKFDKDQMVLTAETQIDSIYFIEEGKIEVSTEFDGNSFVIETLFPGTAINYRAIFLHDLMFVNMRALTEVRILSISLESLTNLLNKTQVCPHSEYSDDQKKKWVQDFSTTVMLAQNRYLKGERSYAVDYLNMQPKVEETEEMKDKMYRRNLLKNVIMRIVAEIQEMKNRP